MLTMMSFIPTIQDLTLCYNDVIRAPLFSLARAPQRPCIEDFHIHGSMHLWWGWPFCFTVKATSKMSSMS